MPKKKEKKKKVIEINRVEQVDMAYFCTEIMKIYGANVRIQRAVPDSRDGLKPVERRVLYTMFKFLKLTPSKNKTVKVSKLVGYVLGNYHPQDMGAIR